MHMPKMLCKYVNMDKHIVCIYCLLALLIRTIIPRLRCCRGFLNCTADVYEDGPTSIPFLVSKSQTDAVRHDMILYDSETQTFI